MGLDPPAVARAASSDPGATASDTSQAAGV
jgi:hypothetical protein